MYIVTLKMFSYSVFTLLLLMNLSTTVNSNSTWTSLFQFDASDYSFGKPCLVDDNCGPPALVCHPECKVCVCADGYVLDTTGYGCLRLEESNDVCHKCCYADQDRYVCSKICQQCYKTENIWTCSKHLQNQSLLYTATQIAMSGALILGVITISIFLWKMCTKTGYRAFPRNGNTTGRESTGSNTSIGTLQHIVSERLRDAPPPYSHSPLPPPGDTPPPYHLLPNAGYVNTSFEPDDNMPPPAYTLAVDTSTNEAGKEETSTEPELVVSNPTLHI